MFRLAGLCFLAAAAAAGAGWESYASGPFQVIADGSAREARTLLNRLEQYRHGLGAVTGAGDLPSLWPIRIVLYRDARRPASASLSLSRDAWLAAMPARAGVPRPWLMAIGRILLDSGTRRMPREIEEGLLAVFSTLDVDGPRVTLGALPPENERTRDWARMHLLTVSPDYSGRVRVLLANLQQGIDPEPAYRNAFGKSPAEIGQEAAAHLASGAAMNHSLSGRPIDPARDFRPRALEAAAAAVLEADLLLADPARASEALAAYETARKSYPEAPEPHEGLGFCALLLKDQAAARRHFQRALELGSRNARAHLEAGAFESAAKLNPRWAEPHLRLAGMEADPGKQAAALETAARLAPRDAAIWRQLAHKQFARKQFAESSRAWLMAERAAADETERASIRSARMAMERERIEAEAAERTRAAQEKEREIQKLKDEALASIRAAEERAREGRGGRPIEGKVEQWWTDEQAPDAKVAGLLERVDCTGGRLRLIVRAASGPVQLLVSDPGRIVVLGGGEATLACGPQKPPRQVLVEYRKKPDPKAATAGEVSSIEFR